MLHLLWIVPAVALIWGAITAHAFHRRVRRALAGCGAGPPVTPSRPVPDPVQRFVARTAGPAGRPLRMVALEQEGEMRLSPHGPWLPFRARQVFAIGRPEFVWDARFRMAMGLPLRVVDALGPHGGWLEARVLGTIPVTRSDGAALTKGQLMRYLAELGWCPPAAAADPGLRFEPRPDGSVRVRAEAASVEAHVDLRFDAAGDLVGIRGLRPRDTRDGPIDTPWFGTFTDHGDLGGLRVPTRGEVGWQIDGEDFVYWRGKITAVAVG